MKDLLLDQQEAQTLLNFSPSRWEAVRLESLAVLEQVMRGEIREDRVEDASRGVRTLISFGLAEDQAQVVEEFVTTFVAANALFSADDTAAARQEARDSVAPVTRSFAPGQTIIALGDPVSALDVEALEAFDLLKPPPFCCPRCCRLWKRWSPLAIPDHLRAHR